MLDTTTARRTADTIAALTLSRRRVRDCARLLAHAAGALWLDTPDDDVALGSPADAAHVARALTGAHREAVAAVESLGRLVEAPASAPAVEASIPAAELAPTRHSPTPAIVALLSAIEDGIGGVSWTDAGRVALALELLHSVADGYRAGSADSRALCRAIAATAGARDVIGGGQ